MQTWSRRRIETILLALLGITAVIPFRFFPEPPAWFLSEMGCLSVFFGLAVLCQTWGSRFRPSRVATTACMFFLCATPIVFAMLARAFGAPIPFEMSGLTTFASVSLALAVADSSRRISSLSVVTSGFLILFCAAISDDQNAVILPLLWMLICVWHLVANRWERLDLAMPHSVERTWSLRPRIILIALIALLIGGYAIKGRTPSSKPFEFGFMPTSGGTGWSDPAARRGVGSGDEAIAAKDHAESFGAVDSDIFLESTESTLFDMFNDSLGPPKKKKNVSERRQGMNNENVIPMHEKAARTDQGAGSFSTERLPAKKHTHAKSVLSTDIVQWDGPTGIRLAMHRYDTFDGQEWSQSSNLSNPTLTRIDIKEAPWFFDPASRDSFLSEPDAVSVGLLKIIGLDSQRLPVPMLTSGVHIKKIDRQDFFAISKDGCFFMPGRIKVPPLTVIHVANALLTEDDIREKLHAKSELAATVPHMHSLEPSTANLINELVQSAGVRALKPTDQLASCIDQLRTEFTFDRHADTAASTLREFLQSRQGGDHLFATTAALMAQKLGLPSRLVTGFYVRPDAYEITAGHSCVQAEDVHVWAEVQLDDGRWFEIEPTPGYIPPHYKPSWGLLARKFAVAHWPLMLGSTLSIFLVYLTRRIWVDLLLSTAWYLSGFLKPRQRTRLAVGIIEARARVAGTVRPVGQSQRAWLEDLVRPDSNVAVVAKRFTDSADSLFFGNSNELAHQDSLQLVSLLRVRTIISLKHKTTPSV